MWVRQWEEQRDAELRGHGFQWVCDAQHHLLNAGGRTSHDSRRWVRHLACGRIGPYWQFGRDRKTRETAPPYCLTCGGDPWQPSTTIPHDARDLLYLVQFRSTGVRFLKIGRTLPDQDRLPAWIRLGANVIQVVEGSHSRVRAAERAIVETFAPRYRMPVHPFLAHFTSRETFRPGARAAIGDLRSWVGRGSRDRTEEWRQRSSRGRG